jgi:integrase
MELDFDKYKLVAKEYIEDYCVEKGIRATTLQQKRHFHKRLAKFLSGKPFNLENVKAFQKYLYANGCGEQSSRARHTTELRSFVNWCYKYKDLFERNWSFKLIKPTVPKKKWNLLSEEMALKVINKGCIPNSFDNSYIRKSKEEHRLALQFILLHGFRVGEVKAMRGSDLRLDADIPYVILQKTKSGEEQWQPIHSHFIPILRKRQKNNRLFRITEKTCNHLLKRGAERLELTGYDISPHRLRDIYSLSRLRKQPEILVSRTLRHKDLKTTDMHYAHYNLSDLQPVVEDSNVLQSAITPQEFVEKAKKALKVAGLIRPSQYELTVVENGRRVSINAVFIEMKGGDDA